MLSGHEPTMCSWLLARRIPRATVRILPGGRHAYFAEFRDTASPMVNDFLTTSN